MLTFAGWVNRQRQDVVDRSHWERRHQGLRSKLIEPDETAGRTEREVACRERLPGLHGELAQLHGEVARYGDLHRGALALGRGVPSRRAGRGAGDRRRGTGATTATGKRHDNWLGRHFDRGRDHTHIEQDRCANAMCARSLCRRRVAVVVGIVRTRRSRSLPERHPRSRVTSGDRRQSSFGTGRGVGNSIIQFFSRHLTARPRYRYLPYILFSDHAPELR